MAEYIEREALFKKALEERRFVFQREDLINAEIVVKTVYSDFAEFVNSIPAADVAPVVRCKDCKHSWFNGVSLWLCQREGKSYCPKVRENDFCSYGERRDT